jgi:hypothetical protein
VVWAVTPAGKQMPLNATPDPAGNVAAGRDEDGLVVCRTLRKGEAAAPIEQRFTSHYATCPQAGQWRRR